MNLGLAVKEGYLGILVEKVDEVDLEGMAKEVSVGRLE